MAVVNYQIAGLEGETHVCTTITALEIAGAVCGVPYVGAAAVLLQEIVRLCDDVGIRKRKSRQLKDKCNGILAMFADQESNLEGSELQKAVDEATAILETVKTRVQRWGHYSRITCFLKSTEIERGLDECQIDVVKVMELFQVKAQIILHKFHREEREIIQGNHAETHQLLLQILTNQGDMRRIVEMQNAGEHVAEPIMKAGQLELRHLRETGRQRGGLADGPAGSTSPSSSQLRDNQLYLQYQRGLVNLHRLTGIPPTVKVLNGEVTKIDELAIAGGTYSDIWRGKWLGEEMVALKALRNIKASDPRARNRFEHEITVWADLRNDNVLPFYGIVTDLGQHIHMVSPWQEEGSVLEYVKSNPDRDRIHLLAGAAKGIEYLHSRHIIHGNVKCTNILVSAKGEACICDFGMSKVIEEVTEKSASATLTAAGSARWLAPELIEGSVSSPTLASDTYSYAMAILELLTEKHPFSHRKRDAAVIHDIVVLKKTPVRPVEGGAGVWLSDDLWAIMQACWCSDARSRPSMAQVSVRMDGIRG